jgi:hypothetical protein
MILLHSHFYPLAGRSLAHFDSLIFSPWTGQIWAKIDRGTGNWVSERVAAEGEPPFPPGYPAGQLAPAYNDRRWNTLAELPRPLLWRELKLEEGLTSDTLSDYNNPTLPAQEPSMTPALMIEIAALRAKEAAGTLTDEELRAVLRKMREGRVTAATTSAKSRAKSTPVDADAALAKVLSL